MSKRFPSTLGETPYRTIIDFEIRNHDGSFLLGVMRNTDTGGYSLTGLTQEFSSLSGGFLAVLRFLKMNLSGYAKSYAEINLVSPTDEEREEIMRVWNEWQDEQKESENEQ